MFVAHNASHGADPCRVLSASINEATKKRRFAMSWAILPDFEKTMLCEHGVVVCMRPSKFHCANVVCVKENRAAKERRRRSRVGTCLAHEFAAFTKAFVQVFVHLFAESCGAHQSWKLLVDVDGIRIIAVVVHGSVGLIRLVGFFLVQVVPETRHSIAGKDAEYVALVFVELWRCFSAEHEQIFTQEGLNSGQTEMCEAGAVVEQSMNPLQWSQ